MNEIQSVTMSLQDKMTVLNIELSDRQETVTMSFDCTNAFKDGHFKASFISKCVKSVLATFFPDIYEEVLKYKVLIYKMNALMSRVLNNNLCMVMEDGKSVDITEKILTSIGKNARILSVINSSEYAPVIRLYYKVQGCLKEF